MRARKPHPPKIWLSTPEEFIALRHSCFMSRAMCAAFLGLSIATVRSWENGRTRASLAAIRLLRLYRLGDLGALHDSWDGWRISKGELCAPDGRVFRQKAMRLWWLTAEQARFWRKRYEVANPVQLGLF